MLFRRFLLFVAERTREWRSNVVNAHRVEKNKEEKKSCGRWKSCAVEQSVLRGEPIELNVFASKSLAIAWREREVIECGWCSGADSLLLFERTKREYRSGKARSGECTSAIVAFECVEFI